jgi:hypothetical protein
MSYLRRELFTRKAGIPGLRQPWIPACAGMTGECHACESRHPEWYLNYGSMTPWAATSMVDIHPA